MSSLNVASTVLSVAYPLLPAGPDAGGGAEQILYLLERGLVSRGHHSIVIAAKGSTISGELIESPVCGGEMNEEIRAAAQRDHLRLIEEALARHSVDLIHFHGLDFHKYLPGGQVRKLATLHLPPEWYPESIFSSPEIRLNCVSESQASVAPGLRKLPVVLNGVDTQSYIVARGEKKYLLWLGRICPEKGVHIGLEVARQLDLPMIVAGPVHPFPYHEMYFSERVQPLLDEKRQYVGPVGRQRKIELLSGAICLLVPSLAAETSSLVAMEAISSGTPVVAFRSGALPEVVEDGITGFIADSQEEMAHAVQRVSEISPQVSRERATTRFAASRMVEDYIKLYESL